MLSSEPTPYSSRNSSLYSASGERKYLTSRERKRFLNAAKNHKHSEMLFCSLLVFTGCRVSEALELQPHQILHQEQAVLIRCLKKRGKIAFRQVPVPDGLLAKLHCYCRGIDGRIWPKSRTWGWTVVKTAMHSANINGKQGTARGLRHGFAVNALLKGVPLHLVQRWLGHANMSTTAIYADVIGSEERAFAKQTWV